MEAPGAEALLGDRPAAKGAPSSTSNGFIAGFTQRGPGDEALACVSITDLEDKFGERLSGHPEVYDSADTAFRLGASVVFVSRVGGDEKLVATHTILDAAGKKVLTLKAKQFGEYGNAIQVVTTTAGEKFSFIVKFEGVTKEASPAFETLAAAIAWSTATSEYLVITGGLESVLIPKTQTVTLEGGKATIAEADAANLTEALNLFEKDLGPGQVSAPQFTDEASHLALLAHEVKNNRRALLDDVDTGDHEAIIAHSTALRAAPSHAARLGCLLAPYAVIPGLTPSTTRTVPLSAVLMGLIARSESEGNSPNVAVAGKKRGGAPWVIGLTQKFTDAQRAALNDAGVNVAILRKGIPTIMGNRTLVDPVADPNWKSFSSSRLAMGVLALAEEVLEDFEFDEIDAHGYLFKDLEGALSGRACMPFYKDNAFYGTTPEAAFAINTGPAVNTPTSIANEEIRSQIAFSAAPGGERLMVEVVKVPITEAI